MSVGFNNDFDPEYGHVVVLDNHVRRITAHNPSPFTFTGTNSYIIGTDDLAIIDPGPDDDEQLEMLLGVIEGHRLDYIFITHSHSDHSGLAKRLSRLTGAKIVAEGSHRPATANISDISMTLDSGGDSDFAPDITLGDGETIEGDGWKLTSITTPGHMANHTAYSLDKTGVLFTGDHVMAWATTVVAPPDGSMQDYMKSLDKLLKRDDKIYLPGHGGPVLKPQAYVRAIIAHRKMRERAILERLSEGDRTISEIVKAIYRSLDQRLYKAASLSVLAHLESLVASGVVKVEEPLSLSACYSLS
ncbi:MBL fold metallo-hydrolase [Bartonella choladocola]|uniref:Glyoxylase, beta-lactamase superfamily II n=1 Tax=Bartonella choladocola TaxID=2750995 RepID=A0A1U9MGN3_9HYPH|nr:MBL fold metallo-hydrolase [Bartonella choladocola]AQT46869.1 Glyoxylase, beta-lactamase superfamily II [Bartonella choladocola]